MIVSTNIAETSLTVEGVTHVIDSGLVKQLEFDAGSGLDRLETVRIAMDSATQRAGRAGRVRAGRCVRLWSQHDERHPGAQTAPEIARVDLTAAALDVIAWTGEGARRLRVVRASSGATRWSVRCGC